MSQLINQVFHNKLLNFSHQGGNLIDFLKYHDAVIVGGACTSVLSGAEINDFDIYFKSEESFFCAVSDYLNGDFINEDLRRSMMVVGVTNKSVTFKLNDTLIQFIKSVTGEIEEIFKSFDFTINMIGYDVRNDSFVAHPTALIDLSQRILRVEGDTRYPISTMMRIQKYVGRGYSVSNKELMKIGLLINKIKLNSYQDVVEHLGTMYGIPVEHLFDTTQPFSIDNVLNQIESLSILNGLNYANSGGSNTSDELHKKFDDWIEESGYDVYSTDYFEKRLEEYVENNGWMGDENEKV